MSIKGSFMQTQPRITVRDVQASSRWYYAAQGCERGHSGPQYAQVLSDGKMILPMVAILISSLGIGIPAKRYAKVKPWERISGKAIHHWGAGQDWRWAQEKPPPKPVK
jgi:hypothetical protein